MFAWLRQPKENDPALRRVRKGVRLVAMGSLLLAGVGGVVAAGVAGLVCRRAGVSDLANLMTQQVVVLGIGGAMYFWLIVAVVPRVLVRFCPGRREDWEAIDARVFDDYWFSERNHLNEAVALGEEDHPLITGRSGRTVVVLGVVVAAMLGLLFWYASGHASLSGMMAKWPFGVFQLAPYGVVLVFVAMWGGCLPLAVYDVVTTPGRTTVHVFERRAEFVRDRGDVALGVYVNRMVWVVLRSVSGRARVIRMTPRVFVRWRGSWMAAAGANESG